MKKLRIGAVLAAGLLALSFAGTALADTNSSWDVNGAHHQGWPNESCNANSSTMLWIWNGGTPTSLTINGEVQSGSWQQQGGGAWHFTATIDSTNYAPMTASVSYTGADDFLRLSGCDEGGTTTTTSTTSSETTSDTTSSTTSTETTTQSTTSDTTTSDTTSSTTSSETTDTTSSTTSSETTDTTSSDTTTSDTTSSTTTDGTTSSSTTSSETTGSSTTTTSTPSGSVAGETGTPQVTPPSTDTVAQRGTAGTGSWMLVLALGALASLAVLVLTPARKRK